MDGLHELVPFIGTVYGIKITSSRRETEEKIIKNVKAFVKARF